MEIRRKPKKISPQYEDAGLFQNTVCNVAVDLIPVMHKNNRDDLIVTGLVKGDLKIAVTFAGRRVDEAAPIVERLNALAQAQDDSDQIAQGRLPVQIEGAWRPHFLTDQNGFENRTFHLIAAKWTISADKDSTVEYGQPPAHIQTTAI